MEKEFKLWLSDARQTQWFSDFSKNVQLIMDEQHLNQGLSVSIIIRLEKLLSWVLYFRGLLLWSSMHLDLTPPLRTILLATSTQKCHFQPERVYSCLGGLLRSFCTIRSEPPGVKEIQAQLGHERSGLLCMCTRDTLQFRTQAGMRRKGDEPWSTRQQLPLSMLPCFSAKLNKSLSILNLKIWSSRSSWGIFM